MEEALDLSSDRLLNNNKKVVETLRCGSLETWSSTSIPLHATAAYTKDPPFLCLCDLQCTDETRAADRPGVQINIQRR